MKLRVLYGDPLARDRSARRLKLRVILLSGIAVFIPFLMITYYIFSETRAIRLIIIGFLAALSCIPVVLYAYAKGFGRPLRELWRERPAELKSLSLKIGFFYGFALYWMILGIVEFLFGYHSFRAALISFVASAAARDGFEIGYFRANERRNLPLGPTLKEGKSEKERTIFPDGRPIGELFQTAPAIKVAFILAAAVAAGAIGLFLGPLLPNSRHQTLAIGILIGLLATSAYVWSLPSLPGPVSLIRFFIWPGLTMAITYFLILAYLLRIILQAQLPLSIDFGILMAVSAGWMTLESLFLGSLKSEMIAPIRAVPEKVVDTVPS
jgi:hypothetical protein